MSLADIFTFGLTLFVIAIIIMVGYTMNQMIQTSYTGEYALNKTYTSPDGTVSINPADVGNQVYSAMDWVFLVIAVSFALGMFISGYIIPTHPIFTLLGLVGLIIWLILSPFFRNAYLFMLQLPVMSGVAEAFPITTALMLNLPLVGLFVGVIANILLYGKGQNTGGAPF